MSNYCEIAITVLKENKFRITAPRVQVLDFLNATEVPVSAYDIVHRLAELGQKIDTVTVYRILDCLESQNLVHRLMTDGKYVKCQIGVCRDHQHAQNHCHHLMICTQCQKIAETHCPEVKVVQKEQDFVVHGHRLELYGFCSDCARTLAAS